MSDRDLLDRARAAGLAVDWIDATGQPQRVGPDSLRAILAALIHPAGASGVSVVLPPLITLQVGTRLILPAGVIDGEASGELLYEEGARRSLKLVARPQRVVGPVIDRVGYHRLRFAGREITLAVAPPRCVTLEGRGGGRRMWGVATQIYSLRREGDGGIGDATAVRQLAEEAARHGADAVALSPAHSLFAAASAPCRAASSASWRTAVASPMPPSPSRRRL